MAAQATTIDRFEARTHDALAGVTRLRRSLRHAGLHGRLVLVRGQLVLVELFTSFLLRRLLAVLTQQWLATLGQEEAQIAVRHLGELHQKLQQLLHLYEVKGRSRARFLRRAVDARDRLEDVLESICLGLNVDVRKLIEECVTGLKDQADRRDWRSSLAAMRD